QHTYGILEFEVMPDNERLARIPTLERRVPLHPLPRLEEVIAMDGDVGWSRGRRTAAEQDGLARGFQKVVLDLIRTILIIPGTSTHRVRFHTRAGDGRTVKVAKVGVHDGHVIRAGESDAILGLILRRPVHPAPIQHDVVRGASTVDRYQGHDFSVPRRPS